MNTNCPHCRSPLILAPSQAGQVATCPECEGTFQAPLPVARVSRRYDEEDDEEWEIREFASKKVAAGICGILLGGFGVHKFILGLNTAGTIMLITWIVCMVTGMCIIIPLVGNIALNIIGMVEGIIYLTKTDEDFFETYAIDRKEWF